LFEAYIGPIQRERHPNCFEDGFLYASELTKLSDIYTHVLINSTGDMQEEMKAVSRFNMNMEKPGV
jgi:hypothetical protein